MRRKRGQHYNAYTQREQLRDLARQIEALEGELVEREAELVDLRVEWSAFRLEYDIQVGRLIEQIEEIEARIARCRQRIDEVRHWGPGGLPRNRRGETYVPVREQYRRAWEVPEEPEPSPFVSRVGPATETHLKTLYRQLSRRFHPDLTQDSAERAWRTERMAAVNAAYTARDLSALKALAAGSDRVPASGGGTVEQRLGALRQKRQQMQRRLREAEREIYELNNSQMMEISLRAKLARRQGRDLLDELAAEVKVELVRKQTEFDFLVAQLRELGISEE
jgi:predicted  nucleic acid-binding Zn-ribbon protein